MPATLERLGIDRMTREDRLALIADIWDSLTPTAEITPAHREELDRRLADADAHPTAAAPWEEVRARLWVGR
jgi:putative addiction module component (TIGR02574 family)